jgi:hypothetical protein
MSLAGDAVVVVWNGIAPEGRDAFYDWHVHEHMPERVGIPGFLRGRRYIAERGEPEFFTLYEAASVEVLSGQDYQNRLNNPTPWTLSAVPHFHEVSRAIQRVRHSSGPGMGGHLLTVRLEADDPAGFFAAAAREIVAPLMATKGVCGVHLTQSDMAASSVVTAEKKARQGGTDMPGWTLMVETARPSVADAVEESLLTEATLRGCGAADGGIAGLYRLEYVRTKSSTTA